MSRRVPLLVEKIWRTSDWNKTKIPQKYKREKEQWAWSQRRKKIDDVLFPCFHDPAPPFIYDYTSFLTGVEVGWRRESWIYDNSFIHNWRSQKIFFLFPSFFLIGFIAAKSWLFNFIKMYAIVSYDIKSVQMYSDDRFYCLSQLNGEKEAPWLC